MAWPLLCTLPKGQTSELEPLQPYKNAPRHKDVCIAIGCFGGCLFFGLSRTLLNRTIPNKISEVFSVKCEIISYCIYSSGCHCGPDTVGKDTAFF